MEAFPYGPEMRALYFMVLALAIALRLAPSYGGRTGVALRHIATWAAIFAGLALAISFLGV